MHNQTNTVDRLRAMLGAKTPSGRSPFVFTPRDDLWICNADLQHHVKYFGCGAQGYTRFPTPSNHPESISDSQKLGRVMSPVDVVRLGIEPLAYLDQFGEFSHWFSEIQAFKQKNIIESNHHATE